MIKSFRIYIKRLIAQFARQRQRYVSDRNFIILAAIWVGTLSGLAAVVLKYVVSGIKHLLDSSFDIAYENYLYLFTPLAGIVLSVVFVKLVMPKSKFYKGLSSIIYAISRNHSKVEKQHVFTHLVSSGLTVGFGGSVGLEAPIAVTGSAIGSNTAKDLLLGKQNRTLLLASGAAAGIAAVFNSPIAGVIFAFEVLLTEVSIPAFIPLLISSATGAVVARLFHTQHEFYIVPTDWDIHALPFYVILGLICGLVSPYMIKVSLSTEHWFNKHSNPYQKAIWGGLAIGLLIFLFPPLYGEGYDVINNLMKGSYSSLLERSMFYSMQDKTWFLLLFALCIIFVKVIASSATIGAGGNGGIFGPSLFTGALVGFVFAECITYTGWLQANTTNFIAVAMGGVISGVLHAPLTGIFLIAEVTGGYSLFVPLMIVSAISYFVTRYFEPSSIYKKTLIERGYLLEQIDDRILADIHINDILEKDLIHFNPTDTLGQSISVISTSKHDVFPVTESNGQFAGVIMVDEIRSVLFDYSNHKDKTMSELMVIPPVSLSEQTPAHEMLELLDKHHVSHLPILNKGRYVGMITKSGLLMQYRRMLLLHDHESQPIKQG